MNARDVLLLIFDASEQGIRGNTAIQKIAYFVSEKIDINMNYFAHYYGPYSKNVVNNLEELISTNFIDEEIKYTNNNRIMHIYKINEDGKKIVEKIKENYPDEYKIIKRIIDSLDPFGQNYYILSWAAKIFYILKEQKKPISEEEIKNLAKRYNWRLSDDEIESAKKVLLSLNLVSIAAT